VRPTRLGNAKHSCERTPTEDSRGFLKGIDFPARKADLLDLAKENHAERSVSTCLVKCRGLSNHG
jgi:hypothetical protein